MVVIWKQGGFDNIISKTYRFFFFFNTLEKALEFILAKKITYLAETHKILSANHPGSQKASSIGYALHHES